MSARVVTEPPTALHAGHFPMQGLVSESRWPPPACLSLSVHDELADVGSLTKAEQARVADTVTRMSSSALAFLLARGWTRTRASTSGGFYSSPPHASHGQKLKIGEELVMSAETSDRAAVLAIVADWEAQS